MIYKNNPDAIDALKRFMKAMSMPMDLRELGLDGSSECTDFLCSTICGTESVPDEPEARARLLLALQAIE